jgi:hypothetical protein
VARPDFGDVIRALRWGGLGRVFVGCLSGKARARVGGGGCAEGAGVAAPAHQSMHRRMAVDSFKGGPSRSCRTILDTALPAAAGGGGADASPDAA